MMSLLAIQVRKNSAWLARYLGRPCLFLQILLKAMLGQVAEFKHFVSIAMGSVAERETQIILSADLGHVNGAAGANLLNQLDIIGKLLRGLHKSLETCKA